MDPIEQMLAQGRGASSGNGPSPQFQAYEQGVQTSLSKRRLDQQQQQIDAELSLLPLKMAEAQMDLKMRSLTAQKQFFQQQDTIAAADDFLKLNVDLSQLWKSQDYDPLAAASLITGFASKHPGAAGTEQFKVIVDQNKTAEAYTARKEIVTAQLQARQAQIDANNIARAQLQQDKATKGPISLAESKALIDLQDEIDAEPDPIKKARLQRNYGITEGQTAKTGETITTYGPDGQAQMTIQRGGTTKGARSADTPLQGTIDKASAASSATQNVISNLNELKNYANRDTVGLKGVMSHQAQIASSAVAAFLGLDPVYTNPNRTTFATLATGTAQQAIDIFKSDGSIGQKEVDKIQSMFPKTGMDEDVASTTTKIATVKKMLAERQRRLSEKFKIALPNEFLKPSELRDKYLKFEASHPNASPQELESLRLELYKASMQSPYPGE